MSFNKGDRVRIQGGVCPVNVRGLLGTVVSGGCIYVDVLLDDGRNIHNCPVSFFEPIEEEIDTDVDINDFLNVCV